MKKIGIYVIIFILVVMFRDNICFFYGNILGIFKLDNTYLEGVIKLKEQEINYLKEEIQNINEFSKNLYQIEYNYLISKVIFKDSYNTSKYKIQYGKNNNISIGLGIINEYGLVGKVTQVDNNTSEFTILKELSDVSVSINDCIGKMNYNYEEETFIISDISNYDTVYINHEVYTSGYGSIKERLYIGKVEKVVNDIYSKKVYVKSEVDFDKLNYLLIVGDFK